MLDLNRLNVFIHVAATQSCSEAAKRLHLSQPTVSKHIQNLEAELNVKLFEREGAHMRITNACQYSPYNTPLIFTQTTPLIFSQSAPLCERG